MPSNSKREGSVSVFIKLDDGLAVMRKRGVYQEAELFIRNVQSHPLPALYAKLGSGFIPLYRDNGTPVKGVTWDEIILPADAALSRGSLSNLAVVKGGKKAA